MLLSALYFAKIYEGIDYHTILEYFDLTKYFAKKLLQDIKKLGYISLKQNKDDEYEICDMEKVDNLINGKYLTSLYQQVDEDIVDYLRLLILNNKIDSKGMAYIGGVRDKLKKQKFLKIYNLDGFICNNEITIDKDRFEKVFNIPLFITEEDEEIYIARRKRKYYVEDLYFFESVRFAALNGKINSSMLMKRFCINQIEADLIIERLLNEGLIFRELYSNDGYTIEFNKKEYKEIFGEDLEFEEVEHKFKFVEENE